MLRLFLLFSSLFFIVPFSYSQTLTSSEILSGLQKLNSVGSVLYIAAHPDDENTKLLAYLSKERKLRTGYLSLTRGDGGQNLIGKEQGDALGLIRTQELLAARRIDGAEQFFTRANDFGYSKNPEETFSIWEKDSVLADVVWAIRNFKPDVIICRFPTTGEGGHGHHTASAILAEAAFDAAADSKRFLSQLAFTQPWKTRRLFWNTFNFGGNNTTAPNQLKIDVGIYNPLLGKGYGEVAAESRSMHKSQGFGSAKGRGSSIEFFKLLKGDSVKTDLFEGINQGWSRIPNSSAIQKRIEVCLKNFALGTPETLVPDLVALYKQLQLLNVKDPQTAYWKNHKLKLTEELLLSSAGIWLEATSTEFSSVPGEAIQLTTQVIKRSNVNVTLSKLWFPVQIDSATNISLKTNELYTFRHRVTLSPKASFSNPYWLNEKHEAGTFRVANPLLIGKPENEPAAKVMFDLVIGGLPLSIERDVVFKSTDPVKGETYRPFEVLPEATVAISEKSFVFTEALPRNIQFTIKANAANIKGSLEVKIPEGWVISLVQSDFTLTTKDQEVTLEAKLTPTADAKDGVLKVTLNVNNQKTGKSIKRIQYDHIPSQFILSDAEAKLVRANVKKAGTNIGYIPGAGDDMPACLQQIGYNVTLLNNELLTTENLSRFNAIITGVRAYNTEAYLQGQYSKLMEYVQNGGNLVVQYNTNSRIGPVIAKIGPFPFTISRDRTTDEKAPVTLLKPQHPVLQFPNVITNVDFDGWIQERGIYYATDYDKQYEAILSMNDLGEKPHEGSLLVTKYGKGNFVYTGLAFFRQLPAGVPGAYRLLANLLSLPPNK